MRILPINQQIQPSQQKTNFKANLQPKSIKYLNELAKKSEQNIGLIEKIKEGFHKNGSMTTIIRLIGMNERKEGEWRSLSADWPDEYYDEIVNYDYDMEVQNPILGDLKTTINITTSGIVGDNELHLLDCLSRNHYIDKAESKLLTKFIDNFVKENPTEFIIPKLAKILPILKRTGSSDEVIKNAYNYAKKVDENALEANKKEIQSIQDKIDTQKDITAELDEILK